MGMTNAQNEAEGGSKMIGPNGASIEAFFAEAVILITGATGFIGKALLEKLLRSCPRLTTIFVLMRPKKGKTVEERLSRLLDNMIFDKIRSEFPGALNKVYPVYGDMSLPDLGLSSEDRAMLLQRVNMVFHSAATVRFDEPLKVAVQLNTRGTDRIMELCRSMTNLVSVVHVSTAYSNADRVDVREAVYSPKVKPQTVIDMCENLDDATLNAIEQRLIGKHPNTYTWTKGLAEEIVQDKGNDLPVSIVRPSIVGAAHSEPFPGWVDNISGITGVMTEIGRGAIRSILCDRNLVVDVVPVDFVVDTIICAAWHRGMGHNNEIKVYNCTSSSFNPLRWRELGDYTQKFAIEMPTKYAVMYPGFSFTTNKILHKLTVTLLQFLPAFLLDLILRFQGGKPIMMKIAHRNDRAVKTGSFFAIHEWCFHGENMKELTKSVRASSDRNRFNVDLSSLDWESYVQKYMYGIRTYVLKESVDNLNKAKSRLIKLYWIHRLIQLSSVFVLVKLMTRLGQ